MKVEIIMYDRIGPYRRGQVVEIEDGVFLRALLKSKKADVLNPPDWSPDDLEKVVDNGIESDPESSSSEKTLLVPDDRSGPGKKSPKSPKKTQRNSPARYGGSGPISTNRDEDRTRQEGSSDSIRRSSDSRDS